MSHMLPTVALCALLVWPAITAAKLSYKDELSTEMQGEITEDYVETTLPEVVVHLAPEIQSKESPGLEDNAALPSSQETRYKKSPYCVQVHSTHPYESAYEVCGHKVPVEPHIHYEYDPMYHLTQAAVASAAYTSDPHPAPPPYLAVCPPVGHPAVYEGAYQPSYGAPAAYPSAPKAGYQSTRINLMPSYTTYGSSKPRSEENNEKPSSKNATMSSTPATSSRSSDYNLTPVYHPQAHPSGYQPLKVFGYLAAAPIAHTTSADNAYSPYSHSNHAYIAKPYGNPYTNVPNPSYIPSGSNYGSSQYGAPNPLSYGPYPHKAYSSPNVIYAPREYANTPVSYPHTYVTPAHSYSPPAYAAGYSHATPVAYPGGSPAHGAAASYGGPPVRDTGSPAYGEVPVYGGIPSYSGPPAYGGVPSHSGPPAYGGAPSHGGPPSYAGPPAYGGAPSQGRPPSYGGSSVYGGPPAHGGSPSYSGSPAHDGSPAYGVTPTYAGVPIQVAVPSYAVPPSYPSAYGVHRKISYGKPAYEGPQGVYPHPGYSSYGPEYKQTCHGSPSFPLSISCQVQQGRPSGHPDETYREADESPKKGKMDPTHPQHQQTGKGSKKTGVDSESSEESDEKKVHEQTITSTTEKPGGNQQAKEDSGNPINPSNQPQQKQMSVPAGPRMSGSRAFPPPPFPQYGPEFYGRPYQYA